MNSQKFYAFNIQNGLVTTAFKYDDGRWKQDPMDTDERYVIDGQNVLREETEHARREITIFSPLQGTPDLYVKTGKSYLQASSAQELIDDADFSGSTSGHEAFEVHESHGVGESNDDSHLHVDGTEDDDEFEVAEHVRLGEFSPNVNTGEVSRESSATQELISDADFSGSTSGHEAFEVHESHGVGESNDDSHLHVDGMEVGDDVEHSLEMNDAPPLIAQVLPESIQTDTVVTTNPIKLSHVLTSLKLYLGKLDATTVDPLAWVAVDIDNDGQLTLGDVMTVLKGYLGKNQNAVMAANTTKYLSASDLHDVEGVKKLVAADGGYVDRDHIHVKHWSKVDAQVEQVELVGVSLEHLDTYIH